MAFFRSVSFSEQLPAIAGDAVLLRAPQMADHAEWSALRAASRDFLTPWEPTWPADDLTRAAFRRRIRRYAEDQRSDLAYPFFIFRKSDSVLVGGLTLANIRRGCAQAAKPRLLDGRALCGAGLHDRRGQRPSCRSRSARCGCTAWRRPASRGTTPRSACWKRPASSARASPGNTSASTGSGRTTCCSPACGTIRRLNQTGGRPWGRHGCPAINAAERGDFCQSWVWMRIAGPNDRLRGAIRVAAALRRRRDRGRLLERQPAVAQRQPAELVLALRQQPGGRAGPGAAPAARSLDEDCPGVDIRTGAGTLAVAAKPQEPTANDLRYQLTFIELARQCFVDGRHRADAGRRAGPRRRRPGRRAAAGHRADPLCGRAGRRAAQDHRDQVPARAGAARIAATWRSRTSRKI